MTDKTSLGDRMKMYENAWKITFPPLTPVIIRIDGKAFHTFTRRLTKPFDDTLIMAMQLTTVALCKEIQGCRFGYTQSDEISLLLVYYENRDSQAWFGNELQKIISITASMATRKFADYMPGAAYFDARAFTIPERDVCNYFIWRQRDWQKNSIQMAARSLFSQKDLHKKNGDDMIAMLAKNGIDYTEYPNAYRLGSGIDAYNYSDGPKVLPELPEFTKNREFIEQFLASF